MFSPDPRTYYYDEEAADDIVPEEGDIGVEEAEENGDLGNDCGIECGGSFYELEVESHKENPKDRSIKQWTKDVDSFDQCSEMACKLREHDCNDAPCNGR